MTALSPVLKKIVNKAKAPVLLRLAFHDAGTHSISDGSGGLNASIQYELGRPENAGLKRGWSNVKEAARQLQGTPAEALSHADLIALLGAESVRVCGGPAIPVLVGRVDAVSEDPPDRLPLETSSAAALKATFARAGFGTRELVCLSGAHTIGGKGFGDPGQFDNVYFRALLARPWLNKMDNMASMIGLPSDHALPEDEECAVVIREYAADCSAFHRDFASAYQKLTSLGGVA